MHKSTILASIVGTAAVVAIALASAMPATPNIAPADIPAHQPGFFTDESPRPFQIIVEKELRKNLKEMLEKNDYVGMQTAINMAKFHGYEEFDYYKNDFEPAALQKIDAFIENYKKQHPNQPADRKPPILGFGGEPANWIKDEGKWINLDEYNPKQGAKND